MHNTQLSCPHCGSTLSFGKEIAAGTSVECLICMRTFAASPSAAPAPAPKEKASAGVTAPRPAAGAAVLKDRPSLPKAARTSPPETQSGNSTKSAPSGAGALIAIMVAMVLLVGGGGGFAVWRIIDSNKGGDDGDSGKQIAVTPNKKEDPAPKPGNSSNGNTDGAKPNLDKNNNPPKKVDIVPPKKIDDDVDEKSPPKKDTDKEEPKKVLVRKEPPKVEDKEPDVIPIAKLPPKAIPGLAQDKIDLAVEKGLAFLKSKQQADGSWGSNIGYPVGYASLCGLTLLECKVPANDPAVQRVTAYVRANAGVTLGNAPGTDRNYDAAAAILFLDRLGDARDRPLIQSLALRLLASQQADGGWGYTYQSLTQLESQQLLAFLQSHKKPNAKPGMRPDTLLPTLRGLPVVFHQGKAKGTQAFNKAFSDNSNTQFALLALWAARRHDVPTDQAILFAHDRFAVTQSNDGGWGYELNGPATNGMTCVGLIGLAMGHGISPDVAGAAPADPAKARIKPALQDARIKKGMEALARYIGKLNDPAAPNAAPLENLYFLWSLERVGMLYDVNEISGKDWYAWGALMLLNTQVGDGSFPSAKYVGQDATSNTCFALLFLRRSNLVQDLTVNLRLHSGIRDPEK